MRRRFSCDIGRYRCDENHHAQVTPEWRGPDFISAKSGERMVDRSEVVNRHGTRRPRDSVGFSTVSIIVKIDIGLSNAEQDCVTRGDRSRGVVFTCGFRSSSRPDPPERPPCEGRPFFCLRSGLWGATICMFGPNILTKPFDGT